MDNIELGSTGAKKALKIKALDAFGGDEEDRTPDLCIANAALSQLSYVQPRTIAAQSVLLEFLSFVGA